MSLLSSLVLYKLFHCKRIEWPSNFRLDEFNWMKFKAGLIAKHWTYQTLNECINASVVILPIEKNKPLNQAYSARKRCWCYCFLRRCFSLQEKGMTVKLSMEIMQSNPKLPFSFVGEHTTNLTLNEWVKAYVVILPNEIHRQVHLLLWSSFPSSLPNFFTVTYFKDRPVDGKISAKCKANLLAKHWIH